MTVRGTLLTVIETTLVMPESAVPHSEPELGPDSFAYYTREIEELFSEKEDIISVSSSKTSVSLGRPWPNVKDIDIDANQCEINGNTSLSRALFHDGLGDGLSLFKKERLKASLKQSVTDISQEVDQVLKFAINLRKVEHLLDRKRVVYNPNSADSGSNQSHHKKQKVSSSPPSTGFASHAGTRGSQSCERTSGSEDIDSENNSVVSSEESQCRDLQKICLECKTTSTPQWRAGPDGRKTLCNACGIRLKKKRMSPLGFDQEEKLKQELDEGMRIVVDIGGALAKETVKKYSDEFLAKLGHMEEQLESYISTIASRCRNMTMPEKLNLRKLIQNLPPKNLDRVVDIILQGRNLREGNPGNEIHIDLENEDNVTLWRLYYYVAAFENAKRVAF